MDLQSFSKRNVPCPTVHIFSAPLLLVMAVSSAQRLAERWGEVEGPVSSVATTRESAIASAADVVRPSVFNRWGSSGRAFGTTLLTHITRNTFHQTVGGLGLPIHTGKTEDVTALHARAADIC